MEKPEILRRKAGVNFDENRQAEILLWAPFSEKVSVNIVSKNLITDLEKKDHGYFFLCTDAIEPGDRYRFVLDEGREKADPASLSQPDGVHGASEVYDLRRFEWTDQKWKNHQLKDYIIYELHTGTFTAEGTFAGVENKIDHLISLGVNAIEIMPVAQFPGSRNWGYDGVYPFAVQSTYGGPEGLRKLVNTCHAKGMAVILDVVYNHLGPEGNYLMEYGPYFTSRYNTPWGKAINFDDAWCDSVRIYFIENALMWFRDFHIDALRLDAVHAIKDFSPVHFLRELKQKADLLMQATGRTHYLIAELDLNDTKYINPLSEQGYGIDAQWIDEFHHALRVSAGEPAQGYYTDFSPMVHLAKAYKDAYVYDGIYSEHRCRTFGVKADKNPGDQFVVFSQNHDHIGNRMLGERPTKLYSHEMNKLMAGAVICSPYIPLLFMGEEYGEINPFQYFVSHTDADLVEAVREGRKAEFKSFQSQGEAPDPQAESTFLNSMLNWNLSQHSWNKNIFRFYQTLIRLRKEHPVLSNLSRKELEVNADIQKKLLTIHRWCDGVRVLIIMNFSATAQQTDIADPGKGWTKIFDSADASWNGPGTTADDLLTGQTQIKIQPESFIIYSTGHA